MANMSIVLAHLLGIMTNHLHHNSCWYTCFFQQRYGCVVKRVK